MSTPSDKSPAEQSAAAKKAFWILLILGPALSIWTYYQLSSVESGGASSARVWAPVALLYNTFGFWPAVVCWPVFCGFGAVAAFFKMRKAAAATQTENK